MLKLGALKTRELILSLFFTLRKRLGIYYYYDGLKHCFVNRVQHVINKYISEFILTELAFTSNVINDTENQI